MQHYASVFSGAHSPYHFQNPNTDFRTFQKLKFNQNTVSEDYTKPCSISLYNLYGAEIYKAQHSTDLDISIPVDLLPEGVYIIAVTLGTQNWYQKVMIRR